MIPKRYTNIAIFFHWVVAALVLANLALPTIWDNFVADESVRPLIDLHKSFGITVFGLVVLRVLWRLTHKPPLYPAGYASWEVRLAGFVHSLLYVLLFAVPLAGYLMDSAYKDAATHPLTLYSSVSFPRFGPLMRVDAPEKQRLHDLFGEMHEVTAYILLALVVLHLAGALKHQFLDRQPEIRRMWFR